MTPKDFFKEQIRLAHKIVLRHTELTHDLVLQCKEDIVFYKSLIGLYGSETCLRSLKTKLEKRLNFLSGELQELMENLDFSTLSVLMKREEFDRVTKTLVAIEQHIKNEGNR